MHQDFRPYLNAAIEELGIVLADSRGEEAPFWAWFVPQWSAIANKAPKNVAKADETIRGILSGRYKCSREHVGIMHEILGLRAYGLSIEQAWPTEDRDGGTLLALDVESFRNLLGEARDRHRDPLKAIRSASADPENRRLALELVGGETSDAALVFGDVERRLVEDEHESRAPIRIESKIALRFVPQVEGRTLLLHHMADQGRTGILNEKVHLPRSEVRPPYKPVTSPKFTATGNAGPKDLFVINWPKSVPVRDPRLDDLFESGRVEITEAELRSLGAAIAEARDAHEDRRIWTAVFPFRLVARP